MPSSYYTFESEIVLDLLSLNTDTVNLTVADEGEFLVISAVLGVGTFGPGTNITGGGVEFNLALIAIPEPAAAATLAGLAILALASTRRRRMAGTS